MNRLYVPLLGNVGNDIFRETLSYYCNIMGFIPVYTNHHTTPIDRFRALLQCDAMLLPPSHMRDEYTELEHRLAIITGIQVVRLNALAAATAESMYDRIIDIATLNGITRDELTSRRRDRKLVDIRRLVAAILRKHGVKLSQIGQWLGRDHSDVVYLLHTHDNLLATDDDYRKLYQFYTIVITSIEDWQSDTVKWSTNYEQ